MCFEVGIDFVGIVVLDYFYLNMFDVCEIYCVGVGWSIG